MFRKVSLAHHTCRSFEDGLKLVQLRGESMQAASDAAPSGMVSVIGLDAEQVWPCLAAEQCHRGTTLFPADAGHL